MFDMNSFSFPRSQEYLINLDYFRIFCSMSLVTVLSLIAMSYSFFLRCRLQEIESICEAEFLLSCFRKSL